jgi:hypothetical protein
LSEDTRRLIFEQISEELTPFNFGQIEAHLRK